MTASDAIVRSLSGSTVLIVGDHRDSLDLLLTAFQLVGARAFGARDVGEAQRHVQMHRPDLIVCDLHLPDGTGADFLHWVRQQPKDRGAATPAIAITAFPSHFPPRFAMTSFDAYMSKPVDIAKLCNTAARLLGRPQQQRRASA